MDSQIISAIIGCGGALGAAGIAAGAAVRIEKKLIPKKIETFSDKFHNVMKIIDRAKDSIYIVAQIGDNFWDLYKENIEKLMDANKNLRVNCLVLDKEKYKELQEFTHENKSEEEYKVKYERTMNKLKKLQENQDRFILKQFHQIMTASYIAVDIEIPEVKDKWAPSSAIQIMMYQYDLPACDSLIVTINPAIGTDKYEKTVKSIIEMWNSADPIR